MIQETEIDSFRVAGEEIEEEQYTDSEWIPFNNASIYVEIICARNFTILVSHNEYAWNYCKYI